MSLLGPNSGPPARRWRNVAAVALALTAAAALWQVRHRPTPPDDSILNTPSAAQTTATPHVPSVVVTPPAPEAASLSTPSAEADDGAPEEHFRTTADGQLLVDTRTRLGVEALVGVYTPAERLARLQHLQGSLPSAAYARLVELIERYCNYLVASRQLYPPDAPRTDAGDALREFEDLRGLRRTYFGRETAEALYGEEERVTHHLLEEMQRDATPGLTLEQKAERAQSTLTPPPRHR